jgi:hypothetical protein
MCFRSGGGSRADGFFATSNPATISNIYVCSVSIHVTNLSVLRRLFPQPPQPLLALLTARSFDPLLSPLRFQQELLLHGSCQLRQLLHCCFLPFAARLHHRLKPLHQLCRASLPFCRPCPILPGSRFCAFAAFSYNQKKSVSCERRDIAIGMHDTISPPFLPPDFITPLNKRWPAF